MSHRFWMLVLIGSLSSSLLATAFLVRRPICVESSLISQVDTLSSGSLKSVYSCDFKKSVPYDEQQDTFAFQFSRQVGPIERLVQEIGGLKKRVQIILLEGSTQPVFKLQGYRVILSKEVFDSPGVLQKAMLKIWFRERFTDDSLERSVFEESLTDLIGSLESGKFAEAHDDTVMSRWPSVLQDLPSYCESSWRNLELVQFCEYVKSTRYRPSPTLVDLSLRALLSQSMLAAYKNLDGEYKYGMIEALRRLNGIPKLDVKMTDLQIANTSTIQEISLQMRGILATLRALGKTDSAWANFSIGVEEQLQARGFGDSPSTAIFDAILYAPSGVSEEMLERANELALRSRDKMLALVDSKNIWMVPTRTAIARSQFKDIRAARGMYFSCEELTPQTYTELARLANKLLVVTDCRLLTSVKWEGYLNRGFEKFALQNEKVPFVQIHLPSLMLALQKGAGNPVELVRRQDWSNPFFKTLGWQQPLFEPTSAVYYAQSAIGAIESFRLVERE